ncbi:phage baseplate plug family protein [Achromobacter sp. ESBL13]|uniref:phage baseplate plug family protein n=1 Tax=Achromobacter sp. ESBL13 TaxID=3077328 RepID=UPI002FC69266
MIQILVPDANDSLIEMELDGMTVFLRLSWNSEAQQWVLSIENAYNELVVAGIAVVPDTRLLAGYRHLPVPPGELVALAPDRRDTISRSALPSGEVALLYVNAAEVVDGKV